MNKKLLTLEEFIDQEKADGQKQERMGIKIAIIEEIEKLEKKGKITKKQKEEYEQKLYLLAPKEVGKIRKFAQELRINDY